ncbi:hypothetical protein BKA82DRAFT_4016071 [Pisolithus tinctorius]|nr:hypothetical protein BKA82DRAFT_4016071 [Pisolithus tinctorius]
MPEWFPWKAAVERVLRIPHPLNTDGWKAGNSLINGKYIQGAVYGQKAGNSLINGTYIQGAAYWCPWKAAVERVLWIPHLLNTDGWKAGNSLINGTYIQGAAYWCPWKAAVERVLRIPHPLNTDGRKAGNSLINGTYIQGAAYWCPWKAAVERVLRIPHPLNTDGRKAGNSLINGTYIPGAACEVWVTQISSDSCQNGVHGKLLFSGCWGYHIRSIQMSGWLAILVRSGTGLRCPNQLRFMPEWCPWKAAVERVLRIPHPPNTDGRKDGQMAGNSLINAKYPKGAACEVWVTQISSNPCQNGVHGKPILRGCWGCHIRSMWMGGWLAIVQLMPNTSRLQLVRSGSLKSSPIHASMVSIESRCSVGARDTTSISDGPVFMFQQGTSYWGWACPYAVII